MLVEAGLGEDVSNGGEEVEEEEQQGVVYKLLQKISPVRSKTSSERRRKRSAPDIKSGDSSTGLVSLEGHYGSLVNLSPARRAMMKATSGSTPQLHNPETPHPLPPKPRQCSTPIWPDKTRQCSTPTLPDYSKMDNLYDQPRKLSLSGGKWGGNGASVRVPGVAEREALRRNISFSREVRGEPKSPDYVPPH